jgi:hypothetical protein
MTGLVNSSPAALGKIAGSLIHETGHEVTAKHVADPQDPPPNGTLVLRGAVASRDGFRHRLER